jgi:hypothetical protein
MSKLVDEVIQEKDVTDETRSSLRKEPLVSLSLEKEVHIFIYILV